MVTATHPSVPPSVPRHARSLRLLGVGALTACALALGAGCATVGGPYTVTSEVSSFGEWPAGRAVGTYAFERLPSQEARVQDQAVLEQAAKAAVERAGFKPAADPAQADVLVQLGARITRIERDPWAGRWGPRVSVWGGRGIYWGVHAPLYYQQTNRIDREVAVLLRERSSGKTLYETRAVNAGYNDVDAPLLAAMFDAALKDFPRAALSPRRVETTATPASAATTAPALPTAGSAPTSVPPTVR